MKSKSCLLLLCLSWCDSTFAAAPKQEVSAAKAGASGPSIEYLAAPGVFVLQTENTTYAMERNKAGAINNTYWGPRLARPEDLPVGEMVRFAVAFLRKDDRERFRDEYVGWGGWFYGEPTLKATFADGTRSLKLVYRDHAVESTDRSRTLRITLSDTTYPVEVQLFYRIYPGLDLVDRWAVVINRGDTPGTTCATICSARWMPCSGKTSSTTSSWT